MAMTAVRRSNVEKKRIRISSKRQLTIPQQYFDTLQFGDEAECILQNGAIVIRPIRNNESSFAEQILADLIARGYVGNELLAQFKSEQAKVRPAVERLIEEADETAKGSGGIQSLDDLFSSED